MEGVVTLPPPRCPMVKNKEVKSRCRADKEQWIDEKLKEAGDAGARGDSKTVYKLVKMLPAKQY